MGRPERHDADYFPFICKDGRTLFILESKYQCKGTGFFTNVMRVLTTTPNHHCCIADESDRLFFISKTHCDESSAMDMLDLMAKTGKIDPMLWKEKRVIVSKDLLGSLRRCYDHRENTIITIDQIRESYNNNPVSPIGNPITTSDKPQSKVKKSKVKKVKEDDVFVLPDYIPDETWKSYMNVRIKKRAAQTPYAFSLIIKELERIRDTFGHDPVVVLNKSITSGWTDVYPLKPDNGGNSDGRRTGGGKPKAPGTAGLAKTDEREYGVKEYGDVP